MESIRKQDGSWECILIDDGSSDGSEAECDKIAAEDPRFRVIHQKNSGVSAARNKGLEDAVGDWIWFVDADDVIHPDAVKCLTHVTSESVADVIYFDYLHGEEISFSEVAIPENLKIEEKEDHIPEMSQWRCVFRRKISENVRFEDYIVGEDLLFCAKLSAQASRVGYLPVQLYGYVKRESSVMHTASFRKTQDSILWMRQVLQFYDSLDKKYYKHLEKRRWNKFFFGTALEIMQHDSNIQKELIEIWFQEISNSCVLKTPKNIALLRSIHLLVADIPFMKKNVVRFNAFVFSSYVKIRKRSGK